MIYFKYKCLLSKLRIIFFKLRGAKIGRKIHLGKITCDWPQRLIIGEEVNIEDSVDFKIACPFNTDCYINIGNKVFIGHGCSFSCSTKIIIGNDCLIACNTTIIDVGHEFIKNTKINEQPVTCGEIHIGNDVWIGTSCIILQGVTIGDGVVIGAGSIVTKSIPSYQVWAGTPAHYIRNRTENYIK
jgi:acetyltransferase-like isoleucine patch superfamily enzyme